MNSQREKSESLAAVPTDESLLSQFIAQKDESALKQLLEKHATLVMSVCRQVLRNRHDAEEAFQETFVKLIKKADSIRSSGSLSSWLYRVAYRESMAIVRRSTPKTTEPISEEPIMPEQDNPAHEFDELQILHEELNDLEEKYRGPLVLCYLEGKSQKEAARELNVTLASIKASVASGREQLQKRLLRRGVAMSVMLAAWETSQASAGTFVTSAVIKSTFSHCLSSHVAAATTTGTTSISSLTVSKTGLTKGVTWMAISTGKKVGIGVISAMLLLGGTGTMLTVWLNKSPETIQQQTGTSPSPANAEASSIIEQPQTIDVDSQQKKQTMQTVRTFGLYLHNYYSTMGKFPEAIEYNADGSVPHSWRVEILPFILQEQKIKKGMSRAEYGQLIHACGYNVDQPWDSPENSKMIAKMPDAFRHPKAENDSNSSGFLAITGPGTFFDLKADRDQFDSAHTILIATSENDEPWTKPFDLIYGSKETPALGGFGFGGFHAVTLDGAGLFLTPDRSLPYLQQFHPPGTELNGPES